MNTTIKFNLQICISGILNKVRVLKFHFDHRRGSLFGGDDAIFKSELSKSKFYLEYGSGLSTLWAHKNSNAKIFSVDTSSVWLDNIDSLLKDKGNVDLRWVDLGPLESWGYPVNYDMCDDFHIYTDLPFTEGFKPDLVLIDGRFRVCTFFTVCINAAPNTKIIFDDYYGRPKYAIVERFVKPTERCGRQAKFVLPKFTDEELSLMRQFIPNFRYVME
jgi:hypothetical protein